MPLYRILLLAIFLSGSLISTANSVLGGNITWNCLGGDQYEITLTYYQDCLGNTGTTATQDIFAYPSGCGSFPFSATLNLVSTTEISDLCPTEFSASTCSGGVAPGTSQIIYTGIVNLTAGCTWDLIWNGGAWNYFVNTSVIPQDAYIHTIINTNIACANSLDIVSTPAAPQIPYVCFNLPTTHTIAVNNPLGYTLSYSLVNALTTGPTVDAPITANGFTSPAGLVINSTTGVLNWGNVGPPNITLFGNYLITVAITMTDSGGNVVGTIYENMVFVVRNCIPTVTSFSTPEVTSVGSATTLLNNTTVEVCAGDSLIFNVSATNSDITKAITLSFTPVAGLPGLVLTQSGINPANGKFSLLTTGAMAGTYTVNINAVDNACPNPGSDDIAITVIVHPNVVLNLDNTTICLGQSVNLVAAGLVGNSYTWSVLPGGDNASGLAGNGPNQTVTPDFSTSYRVVGAGIPAQCQASDTAVVNVSLSSIAGVVTAESCGNNNGAINITITGDGSGSYTYDWADVAGTSNTEDRTGLSGGVNYSVTVTDAVFGCTITDTYPVGDIPQPTATLTGATTICAGDCANLTLDFTAGTGPFNFVISPVVPGLTITGVTDPYVFQVCPGTTTTYTITSITDASGCVAAVNLPQTVDVRPIISGSFSPESAICAGDNVTLEVDLAGNPAGNYSVVYSIANVNQPAVTLADLGLISISALNTTTTYDIESVSYTNAPLCPSNDAANGSVTVNVNPLPTASLGAGGSICNGSSFFISMILTGTGPWTVSYTANGVAQTAIAVNASPFTWTVSPSVTTNYCITAVTDANCTNSNNSALNQCAQVNVTPFPTVNYSINDTELCPGNTATITVTVAEAGLWTANFTQTPDNAMPDQFTNQGSALVGNVPFTYNITPAVTTTYRLVNVFFDGSPACATTVNQDIVVNVNSTIAVQATDTICNNISTQYQVVYTLSGGELPYDELAAAPNGTFNGAGTVFTTDFVNSGSGGSWTFSDVNDCNSVVMTMAPYSCPVLTNAGTMNLTAINTCGTGAAVATWNNNGFLDGNDQQAFILHTSSGNTLGTVIATNCSAPSFTFGGGMTYGTTYYISSVAGDDIGDGDCVNTAAPNVQVSPGTPVTWYETPTATLSAPNGPEACAGNCVTLNVAFTGTAPWTFVHNIGGVDQASITTSNNPYTFCVTAAGTYGITSVSSGPGNLCTGTFSGSVAVVINSTIAVQATDTICNNISTQYQVVYTLSGGELPYDELAAAPNGTFNGAGTVFTTDFVNSGSGGSWTFSDVNDCNSVVMTMAPYSCPVLTNAGTMNLTAINTCGTGAAVATWNNNGFLDGNDQQAFILHTSSGNTLGTVIATNCSAPSFTFGGGMTYGTTYYISSVAGDDIGDGDCVNTAAPNVQVSPGTPVTWYETPTATLSAPNGPEACAGDCVTLNVAFTGTGPWTFVHSIAGVNQAAITTSDNPYTFCVTAGGSYELETVTSGPGNICSGTVAGNIAVVINPLPTATLSASASTCSGIDHCFTLTLTGEAPWDVTVNDPSPVDAVLSNVADGYQYCVGTAGAYQIVSVTDNNNCTNTSAPASVSLTVNALPTISWAVGDTSFCEGSSINLSVNLTGATPFQIDLTSPDTDLSTPWNGNAAAINTAGTYTLNTVTDNNGCVGVSGSSINVVEIATPIADAGPDLEQCSDLSVTLGTAAQPNHVYAWSPTTGMTTGAAATAQPVVTIANNTGADQVYTYTLTASVQQCTSTDQVVFTVHPLPTASITASNDTICLNAAVTLTASGGDSYSWEPSPSITTALNSAAVTASPLVDEIFYVTVFQSYGALQCESQDSITIEVGTALVVNKTFSQEVCFGTCDGFISLVGSGSFPPYSLDPASGLTAFNSIDLCPGDYDYTVVDQQGCTFTETITITERAPEVIDQIIINQPVCSYDLGSIQVIDNTTNYGIDGCGINETNITGLFNNLEPCQYTITTIYQVSPNEFCVTDSLVTIAPISDEIDFNAVWTSDVFCFEENACFQAQPTGGLGNLDVLWFDCAETIPACQVGNNNPLCVPVTQNITYWGYAVDQLGCFSDTVQVSATLAPGINLTVQNGDDEVEICELSCADLQASATGGNGNITIDWYQFPFDNQPFTQGTDVSLCPLENTTYYAIASDGCSESIADSIEIIVRATPVVFMDVDTLEGCFPLAVTFYNLSPPFADDFSCAWNFDNGESFNLCEDTTIYAYPGFGEFLPSLTITSEHGCIGSDTLDAPIVIHGYPEINFSWEPQPVTVLDTKVEFTNLTQGGVSYNWNFYNAVSTSAVNPVHEFPMIDQGIFEVCLESTSQFGCIDTVCKDIFIESVLSVFVPNTFTPDEDGLNDVFLPYVAGEKFGTYIFRIFDRWGNEIFTTDEVGKAWTGNAMNGEYYVQNDVYLWRIEVESLQDGKIKVFEGTVTILR